MEKTKKLLTKLSGNCDIWILADKNEERKSKTIEFQKEVQECLEEIKTHEDNEKSKLN